jgi:chromosome segregation ATPase
MNTANHVFEYPLSAGVKGEAVVQQFGITMSEEETMPVEQDDLAEQLAMEKERLDKLYVAYQALQSEFDDSKAHIEVLEKEAIDKEIEKEGLEELLNEKDSRIRNLEIESAKAGTRVKHLEPELEKMEEMYTREQARLGRVFDVAEELDEALQTATAELKARDDWYVEHMKIFEDIKKVTETRFEMIDRAMEYFKEFQEKQDTFRERMDETLEAVKEAATENSSDEPDAQEESQDSTDDS